MATDDAAEQVIAGGQGQPPKRLRPPSSSSVSSTSSTAASDITTEEEQDMAKCLILLAQGDLPHPPSSADKIYVFECKTCCRVFPSFQALGGHRASHKKPRIPPDEKKIAAAAPDDAGAAADQEPAINIPADSPLCLQIRPPVQGGAGARGSGGKVHECSICGSEFSSGQALGGHMRRHRAPPAAARAVGLGDSRDKRIALKLDLNLPAPPEEERSDPGYQLSPSRPRLAFSAAPPMVGCHY